MRLQHEKMSESAQRKNDTRIASKWIRCQWVSELVSAVNTLQIFEAAAPPPPPFEKFICSSAKQIPRSHEINSQINKKYKERERERESKREREGETR